MKILFGVIIFICIFLILLISYNLELEENLRGKELTIQNLEKEKSELQSKISSLEQEIANLSEKIKEIKSFLQRTYEIKEHELENPTWNELKLFLEIDDTNKLIYNKSSFDCSGFAIELFKRARANGFKTALVEIEFEENISGHMLNAFEINGDLIFIDVTGNEDGRGKDKIAYIEKGKNYGTIVLEKVKDKIPDCEISCNELINDLNYISIPNIFDYTYFEKFEKCIELYESCVEEYNKAVEEGIYSYFELSKFYENLEKLEDEISMENYYALSKWDNIIKNIQIYW